MSKPLVEIAKLNMERYGLIWNVEEFEEMIGEELNETLLAIQNDNIEETVDGLADIIVVCAGALTKLGYNPELVLKQTVKHIKSRLQDPKQKADWDLHDHNGEKWKKWKDQSYETLYKPNYGVCKHNGKL